mmetsp:Transcript_35704/g.78237  ORF Transcript_35704/g.78237 Transcript_35704/m.78237 type:complete len:200 (+) Transcript_35704:881-1480(+)
MPSRNAKKSIPMAFAIPFDLRSILIQTVSTLMTLAVLRGKRLLRADVVEITGTQRRMVHASAAKPPKAVNRTNSHSMISTGIYTMMKMEAASPVGRFYRTTMVGQHHSKTLICTLNTQLVGYMLLPGAVKGVHILHATRQYQTMIPEYYRRMKRLFQCSSVRSRVDMHCITLPRAKTVIEGTRRDFIASPIQVVPIARP